MATILTNEVDNGDVVVGDLHPMSVKTSSSYRDIPISWLPAQAYSTPVVLRPGENIFGFTFDTWTSAVMTAQISLNNGATWRNLGKYGAEISVTPVAGTNTALPLIWGEIEAFSCWPLIRFRSGTSASPVNQHATLIYTGAVHVKTA